MKYIEDFFDIVTEDYDKFRDYEVEASSQARHGSRGTEYIETVDEFMKEYSFFISKNEKIKSFFEDIKKIRDPHYTIDIDKSMHKWEPIHNSNGGFHGITGVTY